MGSLYQIQQFNLPNYETGLSPRDIDREIVTTRAGVDYYDYDVTSHRLISGGGSQILTPSTVDYGMPILRNDSNNITADSETGFLSDSNIDIDTSVFLSGGSSSLSGMIDRVDNGRVADVGLVSNKLPREGNIVINKDNIDTSVRGVVERTALSDLFFSDMNMDNIQQSVRYGVNKSTGQVISRQSETSIYIIMRSILFQYANLGVISSKVAEELQSLNKRVINYCVENVSSNVQQYLEYIKDLEKLPTPLDMPVYHNKTNFAYDMSNLL